MYAFQSSLDTRNPSPGLNVDGDESAQRWARVGADVYKQAAKLTELEIGRKSIKAGRLRDVDMQAEFDVIRNGLQQRSAQLPRFDREIPVQRKWAIDDPLPAYDVNIPSSCLGVSDEWEFTEVRHDVFLYSAYWDERPNDFDNRQNGTLVRIMAVVRGGSRPHLSCHWPTATGSDSVSDIAYYEMCENHGRPYGSFILSCRVPDMVTGVPCNVTVMADDRSTVSVPLRTLKPSRDHRQMNKFTVCVPPLFGDVSVPGLVEFLEVTSAVY
jgi:hypothetical protein